MAKDYFKDFLESKEIPDYEKPKVRALYERLKKNEKTNGEPHNVNILKEFQAMPWDLVAAQTSMTVFDVIKAQAVEDLVLKKTTGKYNPIHVTKKVEVNGKSCSFESWYVLNMSVAKKSDKDEKNVYVPYAVTTGPIAYSAERKTGRYVMGAEISEENRKSLERYGVGTALHSAVVKDGEVMNCLLYLREETQEVMSISLPKLKEKFDTVYPNGLPQFMGVEINAKQKNDLLSGKTVVLDGCVSERFPDKKFNMPVYLDINGRLNVRKERKAYTEAQAIRKAAEEAQKAREEKSHSTSESRTESNTQEAPRQASGRGRGNRQQVD